MAPQVSLVYLPLPPPAPLPAPQEHYEGLLPQAGVPEMQRSDLAAMVLQVGAGFAAGRTRV